jgi:acyl-CoA reductase-like NAD-dependent aldehyde dehydrogenase
MHISCMCFVQAGVPAGVFNVVTTNRDKVRTASTIQDPSFISLYGCVLRAMHQSSVYIYDALAIADDCIYGQSQHVQVSC